MAHSPTVKSSGALALASSGSVVGSTACAFVVEGVCVFESAWMNRSRNHSLTRYRVLAGMQARSQLVPRDVDSSVAMRASHALSFSVVAASDSAGFGRRTLNCVDAPAEGRGGAVDDEAAAVAWTFGGDALRGGERYAARAAAADRTVPAAS
jgi:hypothetical protein